MKKQELIEKGKFGEINGVKVLQIKGTPYEMGYQHGFLLADRIGLMISRTLLATTAYIAAQTGSDLKTAEKLLWLGQKAAEPFLPEELKEEMRGIADGANDAGVSVTSDQIFLWNTNYDQWCVYCHPHYWHPEGKISEKMPDRILAGSGGCSSFSAWDEWAGGNGNLYFLYR